MKRRKWFFAPALLSVLASAGIWTAASAAPTVDPPTSAAGEATRAPATAGLPELPTKQYQLKNGLTVILSEDHGLPSVATHLVYLVGSGHEEKGRTGFAHLFEHLMFQGSLHFDHDYFLPFEPIGARTNGNTTSDRTVYYEQVPSQFAELCLWMESDRMRSLLPALSQEKLDNQREVVKNERRQRYEITPYGMSWWYLDEALFPEGHPYHHSTIGSHEDLSAASLEDVQAFFKKYYVPKNTALIVAGDFQESAMRALIEKYFGDMPAGERAPTPNPAPIVRTESKHWIAEDDVQLPRVYFAWTTPPLFEEGDAELDLLSSVLSDGKSSRLFHSLVYEKKLATDVYAYQVSQKLDSMYVLQATAAPGTTLEELAAAVEKETVKALSKLPTASELTRAKSAYKKGFFERLETYESRTSLIGTYFLHTEKGNYMQEDYARYVNATAENVQKAGQKYLDFSRVVRLDFVPGKKSTPVKKLELTQAKPESTTSAKKEGKAQ